MAVGGPPPGWTHFFLRSDWVPADRKVKLVQDLVPILGSAGGKQFVQKICQLQDDSCVAPLDYAALAEAVATTIPYLGAALDGQPEEALACISVAFHQVPPCSACRCMACTCDAVHGCAGSCNDSIDSQKSMEIGACYTQDV